MRLTLVEAVRDGLATAMAADPRVVVLGLDVGRLGGVLRATDGLLDRFHELGLHITVRPDVRALQHHQEVNVSGPWTNTFDTRQRRAGFIIAQARDGN